MLILSLSLSCDLLDKEVPSCTATYNSNGGSGIAPQSIKEGGTVLKPADPTKADYLFDDWFSDSGLTTLWDFETNKVTSDITLYAKWSLVMDIENDDMISVNGGTFQQFTNFADQTTGFKHTISDFSIGQYEVTYELWHEVYTWATNPASNGLSSVYIFANPGSEGDNGGAGADPTEADKYEPVTHINWRDAIVWCNAYSEMSSRIPVYNDTSGNVLRDSRDRNAGACDGTDPNWDANGYRLPTEGEWQFAASGGSLASDPVTQYSGSDTIEDVAWYSQNCITGNSLPEDYGTHNVGEKGSNGEAKKTANELGLYDMSGNVSEYCFDWYSYSHPAGPEHDYTGPSAAPADPRRILRGGSWRQDFDHSRVFVQNSTPTYSENTEFGFRLVHD